MGGGVLDLRSLVYGGLASVTAELGTFAIDTTKTRLQIQGQKIDNRHSEVKYRGMLHALLRISKEEGIRALYSGIAPAVLRQATYGTIKMGVYESAKRHLVKNAAEESFLTNMGCGMFAGVVSSSIANPTDVLKIRMQAQNEHFSQKNVVDCFVDMYKQEGVRGLWRGVVPTAQRAAIIVGVELSVYDFSKRQFINNEVLPDGVTNHIASSSFAALAGAIASNPIDVVRTRLMNQRNLKSAIISGVNVESMYTSSLDCLVQTVRSEGVSALYKGFIPTWLRLGPWNIIFFVTFEQLKKFY